MDAIKLEKAPKIAVYTPERNEKGEEIQPGRRGDDGAHLCRNTLRRHLRHRSAARQTLRIRLAAPAPRGFYRDVWQVLRLLPQPALVPRPRQTHGGPGGTKRFCQGQRVLKLAVAKKIREYVMGGGFMFAMCSATDTYDIALAADGVDICAEIYDGDPADPNAQSKLDFSKTFAFTDFQLIRDPDLRALHHRPQPRPECGARG